MPLVDDGDVVKALGFVAMCCAHLEGEVTNCLRMLIGHDSHVKPSLKRQPISVQIKAIVKSIKRHAPMSQEMQRTVGSFRIVQALLDERNDLLHGRIFGNLDGAPDEIESSRNGVRRVLRSADIYWLANDIDKAQGAMLSAQFALHRMTTGGRPGEV